VEELKEKELEHDLKFDSMKNKGKQIIDVESIATIMATIIQREEPKELEEGEHLFHSQMWVNGTPFHFIVDNGSQKNLISAEVVKRLKLPTMSHPQPYTIGWLSWGRDIYVNQQCCLSYGINPFKDEVLRDVAPLEFCDVLLGQPYMWKHHAIYESRPRSVIVTLGCHIYRVP
jgi:hypothetical protein